MRRIDPNLAAFLYCFLGGLACLAVVLVIS